MIRKGHGLAISFLGLLAWDASGLDRAVARLFGTAQGFALRDQWWLVTLGHHGARFYGTGFFCGGYLALAGSASHGP